jgi:hypothetical protein
MKAITYRKLSIACFFCLSVILTSCLFPPRSFKHTKTPAPPDYTQTTYWACLPDKKDSADCEMPQYGIMDNQKNARVDVFFIHPTNYEYGKRWNVNLDNKEANAFTDKYPARLEASIFNASCKIYMPRYRIANLFSYFAMEKNSKPAFDLAYSDIRTAFLYYMKHYNKGRPLIIASHSQGTDYGVRLLKEFFDKDTSIRKQLVTAYLVGRPLYDTTFKTIKLSTTPKETGGFVTWNSVARWTNSFYGQPVGKVVGINPITWGQDTVYTKKSLHKGSVPFPYTRVDTAFIEARCAKSGFLWCVISNKATAEDYPKIHSPYYHLNDYNFFYLDIRENVKQRIDQYFREQQSR